MISVVDWIAAFPHPFHGALGFLALWIALLLVAGGLASLFPSRTGQETGRTVAVWLSLLIAAAVWAKGDATLWSVRRWLSAANEPMEPVLARLPEGPTAQLLAQVSWLELGLAVALGAAVLGFYLPRRSRARARIQQHESRRVTLVR